MIVDYLYTVPGGMFAVIIPSLRGRQHGSHGDGVCMVTTADAMGCPVALWPRSRVDNAVHMQPLIGGHADTAHA